MKLRGAYWFGIACILAGCLSEPVRAQTDPSAVQMADTAVALMGGGQGYLLESKRVKNETTSAINAMYNFKFEQADLEFRFLEVKYPEHPLPTFLRGLETWWHIVPNEEDDQYDKRFFGFMEQTVEKAGKLWKKDEGNLEAAFFLAAGYGFMGRLNSYRHNWRRATNDGRLALKWLEVSRGKEKLSPEFLFGDALFNYYQQYIHENYAMLRPVLAFFPKGNKQLGLEQLTTVTRNAFYTRTEAQTYLMRMYANEESSPNKAYPLAAYLAKTFPDNAYFQRSLARMAFSTGRLTECYTVSEQIKTKFNASMPGYEYNSLRYADYFLGYINMTMKHDSASAITNFKSAIDAADRCNQRESGYTLYALYYVGLLEDRLGNRDAATDRMEEVMKRAKKGESAYAEAKTWLEKYRPKRKKVFGIF